jgi:hypothetical protein
LAETRLPGRVSSIICLFLVQLNQKDDDIIAHAAPEQDVAAQSGDLSEPEVVEPIPLLFTREEVNRDVIVPANNIVKHGQFGGMCRLA